jgi:REP element-mobilizing transposase RayT
MARRSPQLRLDLVPTFGWGGERAGSGRKPAAAGDAGIPHRSRDGVDQHAPLHVTLRMHRRVWNLRMVRCYRAIAAALRRLLVRSDFRVVHFSIQTTHLHLVVEAEGADALGHAMRALSISLSRRLNALMGTRDRVLEDRYHAHVLSTPTEVRHAVSYVVGNFASHARRRGEDVPEGFVDPYSSDAALCPDGLPPPVSPPRTWLLCEAERDRRRTRGSVASEEELAYAA